MSADTIAVGVFSIVGTLLGGALGLFGERWVRSWGEVRCEIEDWRVWQTGARPGGGAAVEERRLQVTFLNRKELPVTVREMQVVFYKGGKPLEEWARPHIEFVDDRGQAHPLSLVNLLPYMAVTQTMRVVPVDTHQKLRALEEAETAEFVARLVGAKDKRIELPEPWQPPLA